MSTVKSLYELDTACNSLLNVSISATLALPIKKAPTGVKAIRDRYRSEYLSYQSEKEMRQTERMMRLDYVISCASQFNKVLEAGSHQ